MVKIASEKTWLLFHRRVLVLTKKLRIVQITPIPVFLVFDSFLEDLREEEIYKKLLVVDNQEDPWIKHGKCIILDHKNGSCGSKTIC